MEKSIDKTTEIMQYMKNLQKIKTDQTLPIDISKRKPIIKSQEVVNADSSYKIGIVGIGSVGTTIAVMLASNGYDVEITKKSKNALVIDNRVNLEINGVFGDKSYLVPYVENNKFSSKKDMIIMCTQSYSTAGALSEVVKYLKPDGIVVSMQNVLNIEDVLEIVPVDRYIPLVVDWTATRINHNHVLVLRDAEMHIGTFSDGAEAHLPKVKEIFSVISDTNIKSNMMSFIASRFVLSSTLACVLAVTGHELRKSMANKTARKLVIGIISEMLSVFEAYKVAVPPYCDVLDYYRFVTKGINGAMYRNTIFRRFIKKNGDMSSSQLRALENKERTELDSMCARIVEMAKAKNIEVPFNETISNFLYDVVEGKETIFMENLEKPCFTNLKIKWREKR